MENDRSSHGFVAVAREVIKIKTMNRSLLPQGIYIYIPDGPYDPTYLHYAAHCLGVGLAELGVPVYSNMAAPYFVTQAIESRMDSVIVFHTSERVISENYVESIEKFAAKQKVLLTLSDTSNVTFFGNKTPVLAAHGSKNMRPADRRRCWAFGLAPERIAKLANPLPFYEREPVVLRNFRPSANQAVRNVTDLALLPHLEAHFKIDRKFQGTSITDDHFARLRRYRFCLAVGGNLVEDLLPNQAIASDPQTIANLSLFRFVRPIAVIRWDSWRFWESLAAGCVTIQLDFEQHGFELPVMPEAWKHYVPLDLSDPAATARRMIEEPDTMAAISEQGRKWALEHYSPKPAAQRFVDWVLQGMPT